MLSTIFSPRLALIALLISSTINARPLSEQPSLRPRHCPAPSPSQTSSSAIPTSTTSSVLCPAPLDLGLASNFAALAGSTLTSTGLSVLTGDTGVFPGTSITGFPPGKVSGTTYLAEAPAEKGEAACRLAYDAGFAKVDSATFLGAELGGATLSPGIYKFSSVAEITNTLTLTGSGTACGGGQFIFLIPTTLTTAAASAIVLANGAKACNVYFLMGTSATIGAGSSIKGNLIASASISAGEAAKNEGTFCALNAAVTLINNKLTAQGQCSA